MDSSSALKLRSRVWYMALACFAVLLLNGTVHFSKEVLLNPTHTETRINFVGLIAESIGYMFAPLLLLGVPLALIVRSNGPISRRIFSLILALWALYLAVDLGKTIQHRSLILADMQKAMEVFGNAEQNFALNKPGDRPLFSSNTTLGQFFTKYVKDYDELLILTNKAKRQKEMLLKNMETDHPDLPTRRWIVALEEECKQLQNDTKAMLAKVKYMENSVFLIQPEDYYVKQFKRGACEKINSPRHKKQTELTEYSYQEIGVLCEYIQVIHARLSGAKNSNKVQAYVRRISEMDAQIEAMKKEIAELPSRTPPPPSGRLKAN